MGEIQRQEKVQREMERESGIERGRERERQRRGDKLIENTDMTESEKKQ